MVFYFWEQRHNTRSKSNYVTNATQGNSERILSTLRDHSEITQRSFRDHSENTLRSHKERSEITQISPRDHSENSQGSLWDPSEICLNTSLKWLIDPPSNWLSWRNSSRYCHISKYWTPFKKKFLLLLMPTLLLDLKTASKSEHYQGNMKIQLWPTLDCKNYLSETNQQENKRRPFNPALCISTIKNDNLCLELWFLSLSYTSPRIRLFVHPAPKEYTQCKL